MTNSVHDDGELAEIQTVGIEGIEKNLLLETIQMHWGDNSYSCEHFQDKLPVGARLDILHNDRGDDALDADTRELDEGGQAIGEGPVRVQINGAEF
jgi:hypothetical protein